MHTKLLGGDWAWKAPDGYVNREMKITEVFAEERLKHARYKRWIELDPEQGQVWRYAWDLLLTGELSIRLICEALHAKGYRLRSGAPFVRVTPQGRRRHASAIVARIFHNWFYAGWVVIDTDWATIEPKTLRGNWTPIVTTEEFETGLAILKRRDQRRNYKEKRLYLLQGLIYLQDAKGELSRLRCSTPNAGRKSGGVSYYTTPDSRIHMLCREVDAQVAAHLHLIQVDEQYLPQIRQAYIDDLDTRVGKRHTSERSTLAKSLEGLG
jgi:Recombinase